MARAVDVDMLVETMVREAGEAIRGQRAAMAPQAERVVGLTVEFAIDGRGSVSETFAYITRRAHRGRLPAGDDDGG